MKQPKEEEKRELKRMYYCETFVVNEDQTVVCDGVSGDTILLFIPTSVHFDAVHDPKETYHLISQYIHMMCQW